jgi:RHS repeat-associated protein
MNNRYAAFKVEYYGKDNDDYVNGQGFCCEDAPQNAPTRAPSANDNPELFQYYYHSDHLGSTSLITNLDGEIVQHVEYVPFGEVFIEERNNKWNTPYLFNAKELDEETGLYYYGARYYEPRVSLWISADPMQEKYPGVSTYAYALQNPVRFIDPDGRVFGTPQESTGVPAQVDMVNMQVTEAQDNTNIPRPELPPSESVTVQQPVPPNTWEIRSAAVEQAKQQFNYYMNDQSGIGRAIVSNPVLKATAVGGLAVVAVVAASSAAPAVTEAGTAATLKLQALVQATPGIVNNAAVAVEASTGASAAGIGIGVGIIQSEAPIDAPIITINPTVNFWSLVTQSFINGYNVVNNEKK